MPDRSPYVHVCAAGNVVYHLTVLPPLDAFTRVELHGARRFGVALCRDEAIVEWPLEAPEALRAHVPLALAAARRAWGG